MTTSFLIIFPLAFVTFVGISAFLIYKCRHFYSRKVD